MKKWFKLALKFIADSKDPLGRKKGELLWRDRFSKSKASDIKKSLGSYLFSSLYQQEPIDENNALFKKEFFNYYEVIDDTIKTASNKYLINSLDGYITIDPAISEKTSADYSVLLHFYLNEKNQIFVNDIIRAHFSSKSLIKAVESFYYKYKPTLIGLETVAFQSHIAEALKEMNIPFKKIIPKADKYTRFIPLSAKFEAGDIFFRKAIWNYEFEKELLNYPGKNDDQIDALAYGCLFSFKKGLQLPISSKISPKTSNFY